MAVRRKKKRGSRASGSKALKQLSLEALESHAGELLQAGKYKEAIAAYKLLLQRERRPAWFDAMAEAYAGRARGLAGKGMFKEAAVIWRNRADTCGRFLAEPVYIELLFHSGQFEAARQLIQEQFTRIKEQGDLPTLRLLCAVQALAGRESLLSLFPEDDLLRRDFPAALAALKAYCGGDDDEMERQLKAISFRSPYRDFRQILKALSLLESDQSRAEALLARVDADSPFQPLVSAISVSLLPDQAFLRRYQQMGDAERRFTAALKGWGAEQLKLIQELHQLGERPGADRLLPFLLRHKARLGERYVREVAMRILVSYPRGETLYERSLGRLSYFDRLRIDALRLEGETAPEVVVRHWRNLCDVLAESERGQEPDNRMTMALILRRLARLWLESRFPPAFVLADLDHALKCDPDDLPAYLELIRLYREEGNLKDARRLQDEATARYPEDVDLLIEVVETAIAGNAFKKASRFARRILELDPINPRIRDILVQSHLAHARKQILGRKYRLARNELDEAANWVRTAVGRGRIDLVRGILELEEGNRAAARTLFGSGFEQTGGGLAGRFQLLMEAGRMGRPMADTLKQARLPKLARRITREQVLALHQAIGESAGQERAILIEAVQSLQEPLKRAAGLAFSRVEMESLCESWRQLDLQELRSRYAQAALKRWSGAPVFIFHQIEARHGLILMLSRGEEEQLLEAYDRAQAEGDMRTAHRIGDLLSGGTRFPDEHEYDPSLDSDDFDGQIGEEALEGLVDMLMQPGGPPEIAEIKRLLGEKETRRLVREMLQGDFDLGWLENTVKELLKPKSPKASHKKVKKADTSKKADQAVEENHQKQLDLF